MRTVSLFTRLAGPLVTQAPHLLAERPAIGRLEVLDAEVATS